MRIHASAHIDAADEVRVHDRADLGTTILNTGDRYAPHDDSLQIHGERTERADFLRRLAAAASEAADSLDASIEADAERDRAREAKNAADLDALRVKLTIAEVSA